jgi:D-3-phosphoglycerate dehydrogenase
MQPRRTIVTCFPISDPQIKQIRSAAGQDFEVVVATQDEIEEKIFLADIFCGHAKMMLDWNRVIAQGRLRWIQSTAAGLDHCLVPAVIESPVLVSGCSALFATQVAEQTLALLTGLIRSLPVFFRAQLQRDYTRRPTDILSNKRVGILGLGGNGQQIARVLRPLTAHISATDLFLDHCQPLIEQKLIDDLHAPSETASLLPQVDILIVTLPLTASNEGLLGQTELASLKRHAYLINVGRGSVINTDALIDQLKNGHLAGAGIDVVDPEPLPASSPLWDLPNVIITPHVGAQSPFRIPLTVDLFCENLVRFMRREVLINQVDKQLGLPRPADRFKL